jgi:hypothetical protein
MQTSSQYFQSEIPINYPPQVMTEDLERPRHSRYFASNSATATAVHEIASAFIRALYRSITVKCIVSGMIVNTTRLDAPLDSRVHSSDSPAAQSQPKCVSDRWR